MSTQVKRPRMRPKFGGHGSRLEEASNSSVRTFVRVRREERSRCGTRKASGQKDLAGPRKRSRARSEGSERRFANHESVNRLKGMATRVE